MEMERQQTSPTVIQSRYKLNPNRDAVCFAYSFRVYINFISFAYVTYVGCVCVYEWMCDGRFVFADNWWLTHYWVRVNQPSISTLFHRKNIFWRWSRKGCSIFQIQRIGRKESQENTFRNFQNKSWEGLESLLCSILWTGKFMDFVLWLVW